MTSPINRVLKWRAEHKEEHESKRLDGLRSSKKVKKAAAEVSRKFWPETWTKLKQRPEYQATAEHIRALEWDLIAPNGTRHVFTNLALFIRDNAELFSANDLEWKRVGNGVKCRAYDGLSSLRPTLKKKALSWKGWIWNHNHPKQAGFFAP